MTKEELKGRLVEDINDVPFDMLDEFHDTQIANTCMDLAEILEKKSVASVPLLSKKGVMYRVKVINKLKGCVSVSNDEETGVSHTEYYPYYTDDEEQPWDGVFNLAEMINEAWYALVGQIR